MSEALRELQGGSQSLRHPAWGPEEESVGGSATAGTLPPRQCGVCSRELASWGHPPCFTTSIKRPALRPQKQASAQLWPIREGSNRKQLQAVVHGSPLKRTPGSQGLAKPPNSAPALRPPPSQTGPWTPTGGRHTPAGPVLHRGLVLLPGELCEASTIITPTVRMGRHASAKGTASYPHLPAADSGAGLELRPRPLQGAPPTHPLSIPPRRREASPRDFAASYLGPHTQAAAAADDRDLGLLSMTRASHVRGNPRGRAQSAPPTPTAPRELGQQRQQQRQRRAVQPAGAPPRPCLRVLRPNARGPAAAAIGRRPRPSAGGTPAQSKGYIVTRRASERASGARAGRKEAEGRPPSPAAAAAAAATCRRVNPPRAGASRTPTAATTPLRRRRDPRAAGAAPPAARRPRGRSQPLPRRPPGARVRALWLPGLTHLPGSAAAAAGPGRRGRARAGGSAEAARPRLAAPAAGAAALRARWAPAKFQRQPWRGGGGGDSLLLSSPALTTILLVQEMTWKTEESGVWGRRGPPNSGARSRDSPAARPTPAPGGNSRGPLGARALPGGERAIRKYKLKL
ncbi:putative uncharacterized protein ENSP00000383309 [Muntiacus reevesi]|uniref:putative uncharacterized protein ENSP00000383309 n=1 Tax=Muntiacus reevesi TaxID=9886 RepID=UPI00330791EC